MTRPTTPIELNGTASRFAGAVVIPDGFLARLAAECATLTDERSTAEASRDWWPLSLHWGLAGQVAQRAAAVARPNSTEQVAAILRLCNRAGVPVTAAGGRSGVLGGSVPVFGGVVLDTTGLQGILSVDTVSGLVEVWSGTFGPELETELRGDHSLTVGHFPQSFDISTVGGWVACRGAGQFSTRYGKIETMVAGLEVVLADGTIVRTGGFPAAAQGPDLTQLFVGSEGTLGVVTKVLLRAHPLPATEQRAAYSFDSFEAGIDACRRILRRGATPAVLRLYDAIETQRGQDGDGRNCALLVLDEGDPAIVDATMGIVADECSSVAPLPVHLVEAWTQHRNDTTALQSLTHKGFVVDTLEIAAPWSALPDIFRTVPTAIMAVPHARMASCHLSHSYLDGACLYFTFAATPPAEEIESTYIALWDAGQRAVLAHGGNLSHHHGVGLNRGRFAADALGAGFDVLQSVRHALDPQGVLNPGKLGLPTSFGKVQWP
ncbi:MAG: FAD-binding oxidoreductase [Actinomycetota bacterium]